MAKSKYIETLEEQYTKKDGKSVLRYKAPDNKWRYIQTSKDASGGNPMPSGGGMVEVKWQELKDKRDNKQLTPGSLYRITDYVTTTSQENTRSAGHQFDVIVLALDGSTLSEEGWAMMNESNIYDVTFSDGVTKKCYLYFTTSEREGEDGYNIVDIETLLGNFWGEGALNINEEQKTASFVNEVLVSYLNQENLTYNYFQNSNLSAWKVWYCLDNDKSRFAWADDNVIGDIENVVVYYPERTGLGGTIPAHDVVYTLTNETQIVNGVTYFKLIKLEGVHISDKDELLVDTKNINTETTLYEFEPRSGTAQASPWNISIKSINYNTPPTEEGRGVVYRLIDEFMNDVGYDFKNVQYVRPLTDGEYDADNGTNTWVYTFNAYDLDENICYDATMKNDILIDDGATRCKNNYFSAVNVGSLFVLPFGVVYGTFSINSDVYYEIFHLQNINGNSSFLRCFCVTSYFGVGTTPIEDAANAIYINNKKVLTEE